MQAWSRRVLENLEVWRRGLEVWRARRYGGLEGGQVWRLIKDIHFVRKNYYLAS
jgi:hypothetical protein